MRFEPVIYCALAISVALGTAACVPRPPITPSPGCLIQIYTSPNLQGYGLPVREDTPELATAWNNIASSARVIYGTWRLFADTDYKGFMGDYKAPADIPQLIPGRKLSSLRCIMPEPPPPPPPY